MKAIISIAAIKKTAPAKNWLATFFESHVSSFYQKADQMLHALSRVTDYIDLHKRRYLMKKFVTSHFKYCLLVWMFHSRKLNNFIIVHTKELWGSYTRITKEVTFSKLSGKDNSLTVHHKKLKLLATEVVKVRDNLARDIIKDVFQFKKPTYNLRSIANTFLSRNIRTTYHRQHLAPKIWEQVLENMKTCGSLRVF